MGSTLVFCCSARLKRQLNRRSSDFVSRGHYGHAAEKVSATGNRRTPALRVVVGRPDSWFKSRRSAMASSSGPVRSSQRRWLGGRRARRRRKRGNAPLANLGAKPADHHVEGRWLVTKPRGDPGQRASLHEGSSQCFLTAMERELGIEKEATTGSKIHDACSHPFNCFLSSVRPSLRSYRNADKTVPRGLGSAICRGQGDRQEINYQSRACGHTNPTRMRVDRRSHALASASVPRLRVGVSVARLRSPGIDAIARNRSILALVSTRRSPKPNA